MSLLHKNSLMQSAASLFCVLSTFILSTGLAFATSVATSSKGKQNNLPLVQFMSPSPTTTITKAHVEVELLLDRRVDAQNLKDRKRTGCYQVV